MKQNTKDALVNILLLLSFILAIVFIILGIKDTDRTMENQCKQNCQKYNLPFLKSESISYTRYVCFCLDTDGKPREVPSE